ncbi:MAG TPA: GNAT family N-acetyltransferase [Chthonomonadales bacterium]|nr:GNAT family N-acetyltransferase [Chthonomonadales bacterium]
METRLLSVGEKELAYPIWSQAFEHGKKDMSEWRKWEESLEGCDFTVGVWDEGALQAVTLVVCLDAQFGPYCKVPIGGVGGVACLPAARGRGCARNVIAFALKEMRSRGVCVSVLEPFSWSFYQNLGWDWACLDMRITAQSKVLKTDPETAFVKPVGQSDWQRVAEVYTKYSYGYRGMIARSEREWKSMLSDHDGKYTYTYLYERRGAPEGYVTFQCGKEEKTKIREFLCVTPRARRALLGLLKRMEMQSDRFEWHAPADDSLWCHLMHWDVEVAIQPRSMMRVVDVPSALRAWRPVSDAAGEVTCRITDSLAPWNSGVWSLRYGDGRVDASTVEGAPQVEMNCAAFAQLFFGVVSVETLAREEVIQVRDAQAIPRLSALFAGPPCWINNDF